MLLLSLFTLMSCDIDKIKSGEMPEVDLDVDAGKLPKYDVDRAKVKMSTRTKTVKVPKIVVVMEEEEVEVPYIEFDIPDNGKEMEEKTIKVEAEISDYMHDIKIKKVYATENRLIVVSELTKSKDSLNDKKVRISDQIIFNAPDDLVVKYYIIGDRPSGDFNIDAKYISLEEDLEKYTKSAEVIHRN